MGHINLYKIKADRQAAFLDDIHKKMPHVPSPQVVRKNNDCQEEIRIEFALYLPESETEKEIAWGWVFSAFNEAPQSTIIHPKALIVAKKVDDIYAITFGTAFFCADKFCDRDFGFSFASRIDYSTINTTTLLSPHSKKNKTINSYIDSTSFEFDSGESFAKIKVNAQLPKGFSLYKESLQIGNAIKFTLNEDSLENIADLILHVEKVINVNTIKHKIPVFVEIKEKEFIDKLNISLTNEVARDAVRSLFPEFDVIGSVEIFNNDYTFELSFGRYKKTIDNLTQGEIKVFCKENSIDYVNEVLNIQVIRIKDGSSVSTNKVRDLVDYTDDTERCLLSKGKWYRFNDDYLDYLRDSLCEIDIEYHSEYDFTKKIYSDFIDAKFQNEHSNSMYQGLTSDAIRKRLQKKYYRERCYNILRENDGFINHDRLLSRISNMAIEPMDLYRDGVLFSVKFGGSSSELCFVVDQSLNAIKAYKHQSIKVSHSIQTVCLWFILTRQTTLSSIEGKPDINELKMLMLKNRLDEWKKAVRLNGFRPLIYINYANE